MYSKVLLNCYNHVTLSCFFNHIRHNYIGTTPPPSSSHQLDYHIFRRESHGIPINLKPLFATSGGTGEVGVRVLPQGAADKSKIQIEGIQFISPKGVPVQGWNKPVHEGLKNLKFQTN